MKIGLPRTFLATTCAPFLVLALGGSTCAVSYCSEDCDPCLQSCVCHHSPCTPALQFERAHRLLAWRLTETIDERGGALRTYSEIVAPSARSAQALEDSTQLGSPDLRRFAEGVVRVNHDVLMTPRGRGEWVFDAVDAFETVAVVSFHQEIGGAHGRRAVEGSGLSFLFDRAGNLVEIDQILPALD